MPTLYQAEWCPFSAAVRELLTELGVPYAIRQVEPWPEQRDEMRRATGTDSIPVLVDDDGGVHRGTREIFRHLENLGAWEHGDAHRRRYADHQPAREEDVPGQLIERFGGPRPAAPERPHDASVVHHPERRRYELVLDDRSIGQIAYRPTEGGRVFTHTEIDEACEGRGLGTLLVRAALDDLRTEGLTVVPLCPFVDAFIRRHPEYADLVAPSYVRPTAGAAARRR